MFGFVVFGTICAILAMAGLPGCGADRLVAQGNAGSNAVRDKPTREDPISIDSTESQADFNVIMKGVRPRGFGAGAYVLASPAPRGIKYYVATTGDDDNLGTSSAAPFRTINRAALAAVAGDVVIISDGTYRESVYVKNSGTAAKPIVFQAQNRGGVVLTGGYYIFRPRDFIGHIGATPQKYITVKGLIFRQYAGNDKGAIAVRASRGWVIEDCLFDDAAEKALTVSDHDVTIQRTTFQYNYLHAFDVYGGFGRGVTPSDPSYTPVENLRIIDVVLRGNHTRNALQPDRTSTSVVKIGISRGLVIDNVESYENHGSGMWLDERNTNYTIRNSYFHHNLGIKGALSRANGRGLYLEKNWAGGLVENNVFADNEGAGIVIVSSNDVEFKNNLLLRNEQSVVLVAMTGPGYEHYDLKSITFRATHMKGWRSIASVWAMGGDFSAGPKAMGLSFDESVYDTTDNKVQLVAWPQPLLGASTINEIRSKYGWEHEGRLGAITH